MTKDLLSFDEGRIVYEIKREYEGILQDYADICEDIIDVTRRLSEDEMDEKERKRLRKKKRRLERNLDQTRVNIRSLERVHGWPQRDLANLD